MNLPTRPHGARYPWRRWFSQRKVVLVHGLDFRCRPDAFAQMALQRARQYNGREESIHVRISPDMRTVTILRREPSRRKPR